MKASRVAASSEEMLNPAGGIWNGVTAETLDMTPTPLAGVVNEVSAYLAADSLDHGRVKQVKAAAAHNGKVLTIRLSWQSDAHTEIKDLDQFVDGAAVLFAMSKEASAITMGKKGAAVNAWFWRANQAETPYDVVAEGFGSSERRSGSKSGLVSRSVHKDGKWVVLLQRPLAAGQGAGQGHVALAAGQDARVAVAVWDGGNRERSGRKAISGEFVPLSLEK